jgi:acyl-coenzyme A thioesterase PaaI-like protein
VSGVFDPAEAGWQLIPDRPGFVTLIGPFWRRTVDGITRYGLPLTEKHRNPGGAIDDGVLSTLLDVSCGIAASQAQGEHKQATVSLSVQFIAPVKVGEFITVEPQVVKTVPPLVFMQGTLKVDGDVRAIAHGTWKVLSR